MAFITIVILISQTSIVLLIFLTGVDATRDVSSNATCDFTEWALDANCRNRDLDEIPHEYKNSISMDLRNNRLKSLEAGNFTGFTDLRYLDLEFNDISDIQSGAFGGCVSLLYIYLQFNLLENVAEGAFEGATSLDRLFLNQNRIHQLHPDAFRGLGTLTGVYIGHNEIRQLPSGLFRHTPLLKYLHMGDNTLTDLSSDIFAGLSVLTYLNVMNNNLKVIESGTFDSLQNLEDLDLSGNLLVSINAFPTLPKLKILDLYDNEMREIGSLPEMVDGLDELYLGQNNLPCTCSMNPIREWIQLHKSDEVVDAEKANLTCPSPPRLKGKVLDSILREDLCPGAGVPGHTLASAPLDPVVAAISSHNGDGDSKIVLYAGPSDAVIYVIVTGVTVSVIVVILCILIRFLNWKTQRYHQRLRQQGLMLQKQRQRVPYTADTEASINPDDENPYEHICSRSLTQDSAFGSRDDFGNSDEVPQPPGQAYPESSTSSDSGIQYPQEWIRCYPPPPPTTQIPLLAREQPPANPLLLSNNHHQAVTAPEGSALEDVLDSLSSGGIPKYRIIKLDSRGPSTARDQRQVPGNSPQVDPQEIQHTYFIHPLGVHQGSVYENPKSPDQNWKKKRFDGKEDMPEKFKMHYQPLNQGASFESEKSLDSDKRESDMNGNGDPFRI